MQNVLNLDMDSTIVILADGSFPVNEIPLGYLRNSREVVCCDGAALSLIRYGLEPFAIVGDCDSLSPDIVSKYKNRIFRESEQETNDLTKSVRWCLERGYDDLVILGATGKREDHTIGNISLLADYGKQARVRMITDTGILVPVLKPDVFESYPGQQISIFAINPESEITTQGLKYPLKGKKLRNWWEATLNEAISDSFEIGFSRGPLIIFFRF
jgi:thiamine pyrophosphokinase